MKNFCLNFLLENASLMQHRHQIQNLEFQIYQYIYFHQYNDNQNFFRHLKYLAKKELQNQKDLYLQKILEKSRKTGKKYIEIHQNLTNS